MNSEGPLRILLVDDDPDDALILKETLAEIRVWSSTLTWTKNYEDGWAEVQKCIHAIYLFDYRLGEKTGLDLLRQTLALRESAPVILLTGQGDLETDRLAMDNGAADYLVKGKFDAALLERSIRHAWHRSRDMEERKRLQVMVTQSEKMSAVGQLAAGVAHELNNPLGVILGFAQAMRQHVPLGSPLTHPLESIERESLRCRDLVQALLTFSRSSADQRGPLLLNESVRNALTLIQAESRIRKVEVKIDLAENLQAVLANGTQVQQILINLANNAMDAMPEGGTLTISTFPEKGPAPQYACIRVHDTGIGISPAVQSRIFEPFFTTKPLGKGTGLGLSLVFEILQKHQGSIHVESRPGQTEFTVRLPMVNPALLRAA